MEFPISVNGNTTVNELIAALMTFPPNARVSIGANYMQDASLDVDDENGDSVTILEA